MLTMLGSSFVPVVRERLHPAHAAICGLASHPSTLTSMGQAEFAISAKVLLAFFFVAFVLHRLSLRCKSSIIATFAAAPLLRTSFLAGAVIATGLTAFDMCTAFHGASTDVSGTCHCWLTAILATLGASIISLLLCASKAISASVRKAIRAVVAFFTWLAHICITPCVQPSSAFSKITISLIDVERLYSERGPPLLISTLP